MAARFSSMKSASACCMTTAAASASARISSVMDTAIILAVSIFVCPLVLRLRALPM